MIISISGKIASGKDTVAKEIMRYSEKPFIVRKWADAMKDAVCMWLNIDREQLEDQNFKEKVLGPEWCMWNVINMSKHPDHEERIVITYALRTDAAAEASRLNTGGWLKRGGAFSIEPVGMTPRKMLQLLGTDYGRKMIHPNMWVNTLMNQYNPHKDFWLITDTRFPNEVRAVKQKDGFNIRINRKWIPYPGDFVKSIHFEGQHVVDEVIDSETVRTSWYKENNNGHRIADLIKPSDDHESETALDEYEDFDHIIINDKGLEHLRTKARSVLNLIELEVL